MVSLWEEHGLQATLPRDFWINTAVSASESFFFYKGHLIARALPLAPALNSPS